MSGRTFTTQMVVDESGATARQLGTWASKGWLSTPAPGTGRSREWSEYDMFRAKLMMRFIGCGFTVEKSASLMRVIAERDALARVNNVRIRIGDNLWAVVKNIHDEMPTDEVPVVDGVL